MGTFHFSSRCQATRSPFRRSNLWVLLLGVLDWSLLHGTMTEREKASQAIGRRAPEPGRRVVVFHFGHSLNNGCEFDDRKRADIQLLYSVGEHLGHALRSRSVLVAAERTRDLLLVLASTNRKAVTVDLLTSEVNWEDEQVARSQITTRLLKAFGSTTSVPPVLGPANSV